MRSSKSRGLFSNRGGSWQPKQGALSVGHNIGKTTRMATATKRNNPAYRRRIGATAFISHRCVLLACAPVATSVHACELIFIFSSAEVVRRLARLHALEVGLRVGVERLAHLATHFAHPARHRARVVLVHVSQARLVKPVE